MNAENHNTASQYLRCVALALFAAVPACEDVGTQADDTDEPPCASVDENAAPLNSLEAVTLGGREQWIQIRGQERTKPVLLVLHGGPGTPLMPWIDMFQPAELEQNFIVASQLAESYVIIEEGRSVKSGKMADLVQDEETIHRYLGAA